MSNLYDNELTVRCERIHFYFAECDRCLPGIDSHIVCEGIKFHCQIERSLYFGKRLEFMSFMGQLSLVAIFSFTCTRVILILSFINFNACSLYIQFQCKCKTYFKLLKSNDAGYTTLVKLLLNFYLSCLRLCFDFDGLCFFSFFAAFSHCSMQSNILASFLCFKGIVETHINKLGKKNPSPQWGLNP